MKRDDKVDFSSMEGYQKVLDSLSIVPDDAKEGEKGLSTNSIILGDFPEELKESLLAQVVVSFAN